MSEVAAPAAALVKPKKRVDDGFVEVYGYRVPKGAPKIAVELQAYRENRGPELGGYGAEEHFKRAFRLCWPNYEWTDWVEMLIQAWCNNKYISVIGHMRASKTFTLGHLAYLDYCGDPENTITSLTTVTFEGLRLRMWGDLLRAIETCNVKFPLCVRSSTNEMRVYPGISDRKDLDKYQIHGIAVNGNKDAEGRIRGAHAPRRRFVGDEAQEINAVIYDAVTNIASAPDAKIVLLSNPVEKISPFGDWCEPENGWGSVNENDLVWYTKKGGICLHFDGLQSPNIKAGKNKFTGLLTQEIIDETRRVDGEDSVAWWSRIRGWFPPDGIVSRVFPESVLVKAREDIVFDYEPTGCATLDPAFEQDKAVIHFGKLGRLRNGRMAIQATETHVVKYAIGAGQLPKDFQLAYQTRDMCIARGVKPEHLILDRTGGGRGVYAILAKEWSPDVQGIDYGGAATDRPIRQDESDKCSDIYKFYISEAWFRCRHCISDGLLGGLANLSEGTAGDLNSRRYEVKQASQGSLIQVETKADLKKRLGHSPDEGDAFVGFGELLIRIGSWPGAKHGFGANTVSQKWANQRSRAVKAGKTYQDGTTFF